jgi:hypothetical protein
MGRFARSMTRRQNRMRLQPHLRVGAAPFLPRPSKLFLPPGNDSGPVYRGETSAVPHLRSLGFVWVQLGSLRFVFLRHQSID